MTTTPSQWPTLQAFYLEDPDRLFSSEVDYGVHWTDDPGWHWPGWRVALVVDTGEIYATCLAGPDAHRTVLLGRVADPDLVPVREETDRILDGWAEHCGPGGLAWVRSRLASEQVAL